jgi:exodeoxyribonuclease V beta subunit
MIEHTLNHAAVELSGMNLIEASAGTGKTYAIASLYLRLLIEKELQPEEILVVTYTEAATQELRARIRRRIREALDALKAPNGTDTEDLFLQDLVGRIEADGDELRASRLLEGALAAFDTASIFTIHGFCLRALQENAFESGSLYDTELMADQTGLMQQVVDDFWRQHFFSAESPLLGYALDRGCSPTVFMKLLRNLHITAGSDVVPVYTALEIERIDAACRTLFAEIVRIWSREKELITSLLMTDKGLSRSESAYRSDRLEPLFPLMEAFTGGGNPYDLFRGFEKFTVSGIKKGLKPKGAPPEHELFEACERLQGLVDDRLLVLKAELITFYRQSLPDRKRESNVRFFDDLLDDIYQALTAGPGSVALAEALRKRYKAALIDEFQDTDPVQYEIFRTIYKGSDAPLFVIGDPKQAIYSFRGADIFAYLRASSDAGEARRFTLTSNWRSDPALLRAYNILFDQSGTPFVVDGIEYHPLNSGREDAAEANGDSAEAGAPFQICFMDPDNADGTMNGGDAEQFAAEACASEISRLLLEGEAGETMVDGRPLQAGDIAVIVRTHRQAGAVYRSLRARSITAVMRSDESVFASREAEDVRILLMALADPGREMFVRAALVTDLFGMTGSDIARLNDDEEAWVERLQQFREYHRIWLERGVMVMSRELMSRESVREHLLAFPDYSGERRLTNVLHCFELLHREAHDRSLGIEGLVSWFSERVGSKETKEEYQIRIESDEPAVRIVTVHVSKGLEYPVVFCPFLFGGISTIGDVVMFHDESGRLVRDFGSREIRAHRAIAERETLAENLRLLYVALTRAKHRCVFFTGRVIDGRRRNDPPLLSPAAWLFHTSDEAKRSDHMIEAARRELGVTSASDMTGALEQLAATSEGAISFRRFTPDDCLIADVDVSPTEAASKREETRFTLRTFGKVLQNDWRVASFTSFSRHQITPSELPDRDEPEASATPAITLPEGDRTIFSFPRGARAGILMHAIFETLDFAAPTDAAIGELADKALDRYGFDRDWQPCLVGMVQQVLTVPIPSPGGSFKLGGLKPSGWLTELEFFFPLKRVSSPELGEVLARYGVLPWGGDLAALAASLDFRQVRGMLMGFMDMVFEADGRYWLLDWKSNHLGNSVENYRSPTLRAAMEEHLYPLQYLLYTVALDRYLSLRVPGYRYDTHFGGVLYVFLRGVSAEMGDETGFVRDLPPEALIRELSEILIDMREGAE